MRYLIIFISIGFTLSISCNINIKNSNNCDDEIKQQLRSLAKVVSFDMNTKVYTLCHSKLPDLTYDEFRRLSDSLENVTYLPHDINQVKHFLYCKSLENLPNLKCSIKISDIRKYFGFEFTKATKNGQINTLFYVFNNSTNPNCYINDESNSGKERKCSSFSFHFDENQILKKVRTDSFGY